MADALKKAAVWLGLVSDNNYAGSEYGADDVTQQVPRDDDRQQQAYAPQASSQAAPAAPVPAAATVTASARAVEAARRCSARASPVGRFGVTVTAFSRHISFSCANEWGPSFAGRVANVAC